MSVIVEITIKITGDGIRGYERRETFTEETNNTIPEPAETAAAAAEPECDQAADGAAPHDDGSGGVEAGLEAHPADSAHATAGGGQPSPVLRSVPAQDGDDFEIPAFLRRKLNLQANVEAP